MSLRDRTTRPAAGLAGPGTYARGRSFPARVAINGRWVYLDTFVTRWWADRCGQVAREMKDRGELAGKSPAEIRALVAAAMGEDCAGRISKAKRPATPRSPAQEPFGPQSGDLQPCAGHVNIDPPGSTIIS